MEGRWIIVATNLGLSILATCRPFLFLLEVPHFQLRTSILKQGLCLEQEK
jgi:hypothetical protein